MSVEKIISTVMFADISGSSPLIKLLGDTKANFLIQELLTLMTDLTLKYHGSVIKSIGDEIMTCFNSADAAANAAYEMQELAINFQSDQSLKLRIGIDTGSTIRDKNDLFGETVNNAAYLTGIAKGGKILLSKNAFDTLSPITKNLCYKYDNIILKGHTLKTRIYRMDWEQNTNADHSDVTVHRGLQNFTQAAKLSKLEISSKNQKFILTKDMAPFTIGRNAGVSSFFISSSFASRDHCQIIFRRGKFILCDTNTNGTYVMTNKKEEIYLRREELPLTGQGIITIGQPAHKAGEDLIQYILTM